MTKKEQQLRERMGPNKAGRDTSAIHTAIQFLHNSDVSQLYFNFEHLSQVRHTVHSK